MIYKLHSANSPLAFRISIEEASWIGSLTNVGGLFGTIFFGFIMDRGGRKICMYLLPLPHIFFWIMVYCASNVYHLYLARLIGGITGGGIFLIFPIFISEIADPQIRGTLGSLTALLTNIGALIGNIVGSHVPYHITPPVVLPLPILSILLLVRSPETPQHLLRKGHLDEAKHSLQYYSCHEVNNPDDEEQINAKFVKLKQAIESTNNQQNDVSQNFINKSTIKGIATGIVIVFINVFCGFFSIANYSSLIFAETKSSVDPYSSTIVIGVVMILGSYVASYFVDKFGRKILMTISSGSMAILLTTLGAYVYLTNSMDLKSFDVLPVVLISLIIFAGSTGIVALTFVLLVEIMPPKVRSFGTTFCQVILAVFAFGALKMFPILMVNIGLSGVMWIFAGVSAFGFLFFLICLEETKYKSLDNNDAFE